MTPADESTYQLITNAINDLREEMQRLFRDLTRDLNDMRMNAVTHAELAAKFEASELDRQRLRADLNRVGDDVRKKATCEEAEALAARVSATESLGNKLVGALVLISVTLPIGMFVLQRLLTGHW